MKLRLVAIALVAATLIINHITLKNDSVEQPQKEAPKTADSEIIGISMLSPGIYTLDRVRLVKYVNDEKTVGQYLYELRNQKGEDIKVRLVAPRNDVDRPGSTFRVTQLGEILVTYPR